MKAAILAPIKTSLYSMITTHLLASEPGVEVTGIIVRTPWSLKRVRHEIKRDGVHLINKIYNKMVGGDTASDLVGAAGADTMASRLGLTGSTLADMADAAGVPLTVVKDHNSAESEEALKAAAPDIIVFTGGGLIRKNILRIPRLGVINCHPGILPEYRGMDVIEWTVAEGRDAKPGLGLTLHFMNEGLDTGPILLKRPFSISKNESFGAVRSRLIPMSIELILEGVRGLRDGVVVPKNQSAGDGRQYYVMHPRMYDFASNKLKAQGRGERP